MEVQAITARLPADLYESLRRTAFERRKPMNVILIEAAAAHLALIPDPNPLDARLIAMEAILREYGASEAADQAGSCAAFMREALRGSDDCDIAEALDVIADAARDLAKIARAHPFAARKADMDARSKDEEDQS